MICIQAICRTVCLKCSTAEILSSQLSNLSVWLYFVPKSTGTINKKSERGECLIERIGTEDSSRHCKEGCNQTA